MTTLAEAVDKLERDGLIQVSGDARSLWRVGRVFRRVAGAAALSECDSYELMAHLPSGVWPAATRLLRMLGLEEPQLPEKAKAKSARDAAQPQERQLSSVDYRATGQRWRPVTHAAMTFKEIGAAFGISDSGVEQIEKRALAKLRAALAREGVTDADGLLR